VEETPALAGNWRSPFAQPICAANLRSKYSNLFFRFDVGSKNAILLHDIEIAKLFGVDFEKIKSIARVETTVAKIHSSTVTLPPLHLLYTRYIVI
jgi:hypothetical protein